MSTAQQAYLRSTGAEFIEALRGGQTTFHGPGQLVAYPILDLQRHFASRAPSSFQNTIEHDAVLKNHDNPTTKFTTATAGMSVRQYIWNLEQSLIDTLARLGLAHAHRNERYPGVWMAPNRKIASVGVHLRRHVTSHGVGLNLHTDLAWFDHIVACGIDGVEMTSVVKEWALLGRDRRRGGEDVTVSNTARIFVEEFARCCFGGTVGYQNGSSGNVSVGDDGADISPAPRVDLDKVVEIYQVDLNDIMLQG